MKLCRPWCRIKSCPRDGRAAVLIFMLWIFVLVFILVLTITFGSRPRPRHRKVRDNPDVVKTDPILEKLTEIHDLELSDDNPLVTVGELYEEGHNPPLKDVCPNQGKGMKLMILVTSSPGHFGLRKAVRYTWGNIADRLDTGMAFIVGLSKNDSMNKLLEEENLVYGDIIQGQFIDTYNNLTLKTLSALEWTSKFCYLARFLLKTDDDVYIHTPVLLSLLDEVPDRRQSIIGHVAKGWRPIRNVKSKYYISLKEYRAKVFPNFMTGPAYVLTNDIVQTLYQTALNETFFKLEDVFFTGILPNVPEMAIKRVHYPHFVNNRPPRLNKTCYVAKLAAMHQIKIDEMFDMWKRFSDGLTKC